MRRALTALLLAAAATACAGDDATIIYLGAVDRDAAPAIVDRPDGVAPGWLADVGTNESEAGSADASDAAAE